MDGVVAPVLPPGYSSLALTVAVPAVLNVTANVCVPEDRTAVTGSVAFVSVDVTATESVAEETTFQYASTPFTVTLNDEPAVCAVGDPVFPVAEPGSAVSPGARICNFVNEPALTVIDGVVSGDFDPSLVFVAVMVDVPAVGKVTEANETVPDDNAAGDGIVPCVSEVVNVIVLPGALVTTFQFASTALTVTGPNDEPAV